MQLLGIEKIPTRLNGLPVIPIGDTEYLGARKTEFGHIITVFALGDTVEAPKPEFVRNFLTCTVRNVGAAVFLIGVRFSWITEKATELRNGVSWAKEESIFER